ncbi:MAG: tetratricopeptide repeat protein [Opitutaceae bacterium]
MLRLSRLLFLSLAAAGLIAASPSFNLDRELVLAPQSGSTAEDKEIARWQEKSGAPGAAAAMFEHLGWAYVAKARRTLDAGFHKLAEKTADVIDAQFGSTPDSRRLRAHALHNLHRFHEAEIVARQLVAESGAPADFALLSDVLVEQGRIAEGVAALQRMVDLKPGVEAFARIAHVRWLKGDLGGAMEAMQTARRASRAENAETRAWLLTRLANFTLQQGDTDRALALTEEANAGLPEYAPALLAAARVRLAQGKTAEAIIRLTRAEALVPLPEYQWWLADALAAAGREPEAAEVEQRLMKRGASEDPRTFALFLATRRVEPAVAERLARTELSERSDVFSHDALAWALLAHGELAAADAEMRLALREGVPDARLALHAGLVARAVGRDDEAARHLANAESGAGTLLPSERARLRAACGELPSSE